MPLRVRKLARELDRSPEDLLLLLKELGFERYKTADDLVADDVLATVRRSARDTPPRARLPAAAPVRPAPKPAVEEELPDLMAQLVPGLTRSGQPPKPKVRRPPPTPADAPLPEPSARPSSSAAADRRVDDVRAELAKERVRLETVRDGLAAERSAIVAEKQALIEAREALEAERAALSEAVTARADQLHRRSLLGLLEERGLSGLDEAERAVGALAQSRSFGRWLGSLTVQDPEPVRRLLADRLLLVAGPPEELGGEGAVVQVAPARADVELGPDLKRHLGHVGQALLLEGCRRPVLVGVPPRWQSYLREGLDRRVELLFRPGGPRDEIRAKQDAAAGDTVVTWNTDLGPEARKAYADARKRLVELRGRTLGDLLSGWLGIHRGG